MVRSRRPPCDCVCVCALVSAGIELRDVWTFRGFFGGFGVRGTLRILGAGGFSV